MGNWDPGTVHWQMPRPSRPLKVVMGLVLGLWIVSALALNWGDAPASLYLLLCGNTQAIAAGQLWRLLSAPWLHATSGTVGHVLGVLLGLFFLGPVLEEAWGARRLLRFLALSALVAYSTQVLIELLLRAAGAEALASKLVPEYWFGGVPVLEAMVIAFATGFPGRQLRLMFVFPIGGRALVLITVGISLLFLIAGALGPSGFIAPFAGMLAGWLFGSTPSVPRRWWLRLRLKRLDQEARADRNQRASRARRAGLRVLPGGKDDEPPTWMN
jgi:membrane associated rhomboid family serine protease